MSAPDPDAASMPAWLSALSYAGTLVLGILIGFLSDWANDWRRDKMAAKAARKEADEKFERAVTVAADLMKEMKTDLAVPDQARTRIFFVLPETGFYNFESPHVFEYREDEINDYLGKAKTLEALGYVRDVTNTPGAPQFRFEEHFVDALAAWQPKE